MDIIFRNSVPTAKKTQHVSIAKTSWLMLFREMIVIYSDNHTKLINTLCWQNAEILNVITGGAYKLRGSASLV
jgi:hypothetical protein